MAPTLLVLLDDHRDGLAGFDLGVLGARQYALSFRDRPEGDVWRRAANEVGAYGGWRWECSSVHASRNMADPLMAALAARITAVADASGVHATREPVVTAIAAPEARTAFSTLADTLEQAATADTIEATQHAMCEAARVLRSIHPRALPELATRDEIEAARRLYANDDIAVDADASSSPTEHGVWVHAWVFVERPS